MTKVNLPSITGVRSNFEHFGTHMSSTFAQDILRMKEGDTLLTFNGEGFDFEIWKRLWGVDVRGICERNGIKHIDVYKLAKLVHSDLPSHSLANLGKHYFPNNPALWKGEITDFDNAPMADLLSYCRKDCELTYRVWARLNNELTDPSFTESNGNWDWPLRVEQKVQQVHNKQVAARVHFNRLEARKLAHKLEGEMTLIEADLEPHMPMCRLPESKLHYPPKVQFLKNGEPSELLKKYIAKYNAVLSYDNTRNKWSVYTKGIRTDLPLVEPLVTHEKITLSKQKQLKDWLLGRGWKPTMWNYKTEEGSWTKVRTSPRLTDRQTKEPCPNLRKINWVHGADVAKWLMLRARKNLIFSENGTGWLAKVDTNSTLTADADTLGANTGRYIHKNIVNVPRVTSAYGRELRSLFDARKDMVWVGWDASGLETRVEAHYCYDHVGGREYAKELVDGDVHTKNQNSIGLLSRDDAKSFKYMLMYGAQPPKVAAHFGVSTATAEDWYDDYWKACPALTSFKKNLENEWMSLGKKYIVGLDGRLIATRSKHSLVNAKFQSAGAIIMKHAMLLADKAITNANLDAYGLIRYHDEEQWESLPEHAHAVGKLGILSIKQAGEFLKLRVPLEAEYKIGNNWAETH